MNRSESLSRAGALAEAQALALSRSNIARPYKGHRHFWRRALSRRNFFGAAAGVVGGAGMLLGERPLDTAAPRPIPWRNSALRPWY